MSETLDPKVAWLDGNERAKVDLTFEFYRGFHQWISFSLECKHLQILAVEDLVVSLP